MGIDFNEFRQVLIEDQDSDNVEELEARQIENPAEIPLF
jgi:hypothetical protein